MYGQLHVGHHQRVERPVLETFTRPLGTAVPDHGSLELLGVRRTGPRSPKLPSVPSPS